MSTTGELTIRLAGNRRIEADVGPHTVHTDQPEGLGGEGLAPSPYELFLASIGTCAGVFVQGFCAKRGIPFDQIILRERVVYREDGVPASVDLEIQLPETFPEKYRDAVVKVADQCSVKRAIQAQPLFHVSAVRSGEAHAHVP